MKAKTKTEYIYQYESNIVGMTIGTVTKYEHSWIFDK